MAEISEQNRWEKELAQFQELLANPTGQAIVIVGPEGSGKSALLTILVKHAKNVKEFQCDGNIHRIGPGDHPNNILGAIGKGTGGPLTYLSVGSIIERLSNSVEEFGDLHRRVVGIDANHTQPRELLRWWLEIIPQLPDKVKFIFTQRPDDILATNEKFMELPNVVRIDLEMLPVSSERQKVFDTDEDLRIDFEKNLVDKKGYTPENYSTDEEPGELAVTRIWDNEQKILALMTFCLERSRAGKAFDGIQAYKRKKGIRDVPNYVIFASDILYGSFTMSEFGILRLTDKGDLEQINFEDFPSYENLKHNLKKRMKTSEENSGDNTKKSLIKNLEDFLINEKEFPSNYFILLLAQDTYVDFSVTYPESEDILVDFIVKSEKHIGSISETFKTPTKVQKVGVGEKYKPFKYRVSPSEESNDDFVIFEDVDDENSEIISHQDFPTFTQLLFAYPLNKNGRRIYRELIRIAKYRHGFKIQTTSQDYINLQIKKDKNTAAQIHRYGEPDSRVGLVLAGYIENFPNMESSNIESGVISLLSGFKSGVQTEINWLKGNIGHQQLKYEAGVYILSPEVLVGNKIKDGVNELLELAKENAEKKGPAEPEEHPMQKAYSRGNIATIRVEGIGEVDRLGRDILVKTLAGMFIHTNYDNGFTMALLGDWGQGKSTMMGLLQTELKKEHKDEFEFVTYNAWEYEQTENVSAGIAQEVVKGLTCNIGEWKKLPLRFKFAWREYNEKLRRLVTITLIAFNISIISLDIALLMKNIPSWYKFIPAIFGLSAIGWPLASFRYLKKIFEHPLSTQLQTYLKLPDYGEHLGLIPVLKRHIIALCDFLLDQKKKLVVFVDDLDRCNVNHIAKVLDATRLVMTIPNVIVMIGIDHRIAFSAIRNHYKQVGEKDDKRGPAEIARDYLGKKIQLPLQLSAASYDELKQFVFEGLFDEKSLIDEHKPIEESEKKDFDEKPLEVSPSDGIGLEDVVQVERTDKVTKEPAAKQEVTEEQISEAIKDTKSERDEFYILAGKFEFSNPRQLLRLHNSFRFLKGFSRGKGSGYDSLDILRMLFWQEFLHNWPINMRNRCMSALIDETQIEQAEPEIRKVLKNVKRDISKLFSEQENYKELADFVRIVVLPHNEEGILDTEEQINDWLMREKETEE